MNRPAAWLVVALVAGLLSSVAVAFAPGAAVLLAPAMRTMLANATNAAVAAIGTTAVRASLPRVATVGGLAVPVTVSRTLGKDALVMGALGVGGITAGALVPLADGLDCRLSISLECDPLTGQVPIPEYFDAVGNSMPCGPNLTAEIKGATPTQWAAAVAQHINSLPCTANFTYWNRTDTYSVDSCTPTAYCTFRVDRVLRESPNWQPQYSTVYVTRQAGSRTALGCAPPSPGAANSDATKCKTGNYSPASPQQAYDRWEAKGKPDVANMPEAAQQAADAGAEWTTEQAPQTIEGPATVPLPATTKTTTAPDGTVTETTTQPRYDVTYEGDTITWHTTTTTTTTVTAPGQAPVVTVSVETTAPTPGTPPVAQPEPTPVELETCGLPNTPKCRMDETGTPTAPAEFEPGSDPTAPLLGIIEAPEIADVEWSWSFEFPTGCSTIALPEFGGATIGPVDICQFQPYVHDLMTVVWGITGILGGLRVITRTMGET